MLSSVNKKQGAKKTKITVIIGYLLVMVVMTLGIITLYNNLVDFSDKKIKNESMSELLLVGNTLSMLYEIESEQNLINAENATQYFHTYDSIAPKIIANLFELKQVAVDTIRVTKLDSIGLLVDMKRGNLQEVAVLLDSIRRSPRIVFRTESSYVPQRLNQEIADYLESKNLKNTVENMGDTSVMVGPRRGFMNRVRDVFVARSDSTLVIEKKSVVSDNDFKLIIDTIVHKVRYSERLDLERQRHFQLAFLARQESMRHNNRMLTSRIDELLKEIEHEELVKSLLLIREKEQVILNSQQAMFIAFCVSLLVAFVFAVLFLIDINKGQRYRRQLEASNKRITDLLDAREKLMLTISHDIKAPMSSILGFIELMDTHGDQKSESYLNNMKNSGEQILNLASALLDYHKLDEGKWQLKETNINLYSLINNTAMSFEPLAQRKGLKYNINNSLPEQLVAYTDPYVLRQIMNNLISNAVKYTSKGSITINARLETEDSQNRLLISVRDTGTGIDDDDQKKIFQIFKQLDNSTGIDGSGLGLAITKGFVEELNGNIFLNSRKGEGAEFIAAIPVKDALVDNELLKETMVKDMDLKGISVLLVDDDPVQLTMTSEMLDRMNVQCVTEQNPEHVLPLLQSKTFDILFIDLNMPGMDGRKLVEKLCSLEGERLKNIPIVGLSARSDLSSRDLKTFGFTDFLTKPFTSGKLYATIHRYVSGIERENEPFEPINEQPCEEKGAFALIEFVSDDDITAKAILQSFITETRKSRVQLEKAFQAQHEKIAQGIVHKILPLFRLMGNKPLIVLMEKLEKGEDLPEKDKAFVLDKINDQIQDAQKLMNSIGKS